MTTALRKILVGTDGFGPAGAAVERACDLAAAHDAEVIAVHAYPRDDQQGAPFGPRDEGRSIDAAEGVLRDVEKNHGSRVTLRTVLRSGDPAEVLLDLAEEEEVDLIVVGNKGMSKRLSVGVVPNRISHHAPCSVLIVRTAE